MKNMKSENSQHNKKAVIIIVLSFLVVCFVAIMVSGNRYKDFLGKDIIQGCLPVEEYGKEGNDEGCLKYYKTARANYTATYGLQFELFQMKNNTFASEKYLTLKEGYIQSEHKEERLDNMTIVDQIIEEDDICYIIQQDTSVYMAKGSKKNHKKHLRWFDLIGVEYNVL